MLLSRYIIREHIAPFVYGLALIIFIFTLNLLLQQLKRIVGKGIPFLLIVEFFALNLAWILALAVPMAVLIATVAAFGRLSGDGEITALRASGISPWQLIRGPILASVLVAVGVWWFNNYQLPEMNHRTKMLQIDISRKKPTAIIEPNVYTFAIPNYVLHAREVFPETGGLAGITIYDEHIPEARATVSAERGLLNFIPAQEKYTLTLYSGQIHRPSNREPAGYEVTTFDSAFFHIPAPGILMQRGKEGSRGDRELSVRELLTQVRQLKSQPAPSESYIQKRISSYLVEVHKKFSIPAACVVFIILGAPLGILAHRGGIGLAGGISLVFFVIYWMFLSNGETLADRGKLSPAAAMWLPNFILALAGFWFLWLARRRTSFPGAAALAHFWKRIFPSQTTPDKSER